MNILETMLQTYEKLSYTSNYILGYTLNGNVYFTMCNENDLPNTLKLDKTSSVRHAGYALRFLPNRKSKKALASKESTILCSKNDFEDIVKNSKYNRGEIFEKLITEFFNQEWKKNNIPFTQQGDIVINNTHYQVKYQRATFCTQRSLENLARG